MAERLAAAEEFLDSNPGDFDPTVRSITEGARGRRAVEAFRGQYRLNELRQKVAPVWDDLDALLLPTSPAKATVAAMQGDPIGENSRLGRYTSFASLMGCAAIANPAGFGASGLPAGVMLVAPGFTDDALVPWPPRCTGMPPADWAGTAPPPCPTRPRRMRPTAGSPWLSSAPICAACRRTFSWPRQAASSCARPRPRGDTAFTRFPAPRRQSPA